MLPLDMSAVSTAMKAARITLAAFTFHRRKYLNRKDFKRYMQQGLGRCVLTLHESDNIEKYRDIVLWGCLHNLSFDTQCEGTRAAYIYRLVSCFHDDAYFIAPTIDAFLKLRRHDDWPFEHFCELLRMFAENGSLEAKQTLYEKYESLLYSLTVKRRFKSFDSERDNFEFICISLTSLDGTDALLKIAEDMGSLFKKNPHYDSGNFAWFFDNSKDKFGKKQFVSFLKHEAKRSENISFLYENYQKVIPNLYKTVSDTPEIPCADNFIAEVNTTGTLSRAAKRSFSRCTEDEKMRLAIFVLNEDDLSRKAELLSTFQYEGFPIQHDTLIAYSKSDNDKLRKAAFDVLTNCKSDAVRQYAHELLDSGENTDYAIKMLIFNYTPDDKSLLLSALSSLKVDYNDESDWHRIGLKIFDAFDLKIKLPKECLLFIYETTLCSFCRESAVRYLAKHKWLTANIIEECRYDSNREIVEYVNRYYPSK